MIRSLLAVLGLAALGCAPATPGPTREPSEAAGSVRLLFNDPTLANAPRDGCTTEMCTALVELIDGAEHTIDFAVYGVRNQTRVVRALEEAAARGVKLRGVVDRDAEGHNYYSSTDALVAKLGSIHGDEAWERRAARKQRGDGPGPDACPRPAGFEGPLQCLAYDLGDQCLLAAHASREPLDGGGAIMHDKFFVVDGRHVFTGSANVSDSGIGGYNANVVALVDSVTVAAWYTSELDQMFAGKFHGDKTSTGPKETTVGSTGLSLFFSPHEPAMHKGVRPLIRQARERIDVAVFFLTHKHVVGDLIEAHLRGVKIRVIMDATGATNGYTKHELLRAAGIPVKVETWGGKMHMKSAVIDGESVIVGSMNWTSAGEYDNDENTLILRDPRLAARYSQFFDRMWASIDDRWLGENPAPESRDSGTACTDGSDNDFDDLKDGDDPGCSENPPPLPALPPVRLVDKGERTVCDWSMVSDDQ